MPRVSPLQIAALARGILVAGLLLVSGCESSVRSPAAGPPAAGPRSESGLATYYADSLAGNKTASSETYDPSALTAAHRTLKFGTIVDVRRKDGRSVRVRINDRGPFASKKRIIDLSRRAAEEIGMIRDGVVPVTVTVVSAP